MRERSKHGGLEEQQQRHLQIVALRDLGYTLKQIVLVVNRERSVVRHHLVNDCCCFVKKGKIPLTSGDDSRMIRA